jgi:hypothetical protein
MYFRLTYLKEGKNEGSEVLTAVLMKSTIFWDTKLGLSPAFTLVSYSASSTLKMEATCSSETSADFQRTTRRYIPQDNTLHEIKCSTLQQKEFLTPGVEARRSVVG